MRKGERRRGERWEEGERKRAGVWRREEERKEAGRR